MKGRYVDVYRSLDVDGKQYLESNSVLKRLNENDTIWQHMRVEYFYELVRSSKLHFKPIKDYSTDLERNPVLNCLGLDKMLSWVSVALYFAFHAIGAHSFISCWYRGPYIVDSIFKRFTKGSDGNADDQGGIAIKTSPKKLFDSIAEHPLVDCDISIYYGLVEYLPSGVFTPSYSSDITTSETIRINSIIPYFFKRTNLADESEFRILARVLSKSDADLHTISNIVEFSYLQLPISLADAIEGFAIPISRYPIKEDMINLLSEHGYKAVEKDHVLDGYAYYTLARK